MDMRCVAAAQGNNAVVHANGERIARYRPFMQQRHFLAFLDPHFEQFAGKRIVALDAEDPGALAAQQLG